MAKIADRYFLVDPWRIIEEGFDPSHGRVAEAVFSVANEFMGTRGYFEEGYSGDSLLGSYFNAVFATDIAQQFHYKGLVSRDCFVVNAVDWLYTRIAVDGEQLDLAKCSFRDFLRTLDMKTGVLSRTFIWELSNGKQLKLSFLRFTSMDTPHIGCQRITLEPLNFSGEARIQSCLDFRTVQESTGRNYWTCLYKQQTDAAAAMLALTPDSGQQVFSSFRLELPAPVMTRTIEDEKLIGVEFALPLTQGKSATMDKIVLNHAERKRGIASKEVWEQGMRLAESFSAVSLDALLARHVKHWARTWETLDIAIEGDPENQQGVRFCVFNLHQTYHGGDSTLNIGGKGLSGEAYGGKTWWDTESYILPFYLFNNPEAARNLVEYRYHHLPQALARAKEMDCSGACYPMSTIDGTECCNWWTHGNLEIHVSAAIPYGVWHYVHVTGDKDFLYTHGIEMLIQSCRYFASRGQRSPLTGKFGFYGVMGPDEFHMMVHNNYYTNFMVKKIFEYTLQVIDEMTVNALPQLNQVLEKTGMQRSEAEEWGDMAAAMRLPLDEKTGIYEQHDGFFDLPHTDVKAIPHTQFPIYHHWSYDRIFRTDMIKQVDSLLPLLFFSQEFSYETKRVNYEYYEPRCSHESSLSPCIHSILAAELKKHEQAHAYAQFASRLDLDDYNRNTREGLHTTSLAGTWLNIVYGFGGLRSDGDRLVFNPSMPRNWTSFSFTIQYRGARIHVKISRESVSLKTSGAFKVPVIVFGTACTVDCEGVELAMPSDRLG